MELQLPANFGNQDTTHRPTKQRTDKRGHRGNYIFNNNSHINKKTLTKSKSAFMYVCQIRHLATGFPKKTPVSKKTNKNIPDLLSDNEEG